MSDLKLVDLCESVFMSLCSRHEAVVSPMTESAAGYVKIITYKALGYNAAILSSVLCVLKEL